MKDWVVAPAADVRARMAAILLGDTLVPLHLGAITLREHQRDAAGRLRRALLRFGGALLADDVGLGKTYAALAATQAFGRLLILGPASLRAMWRQALVAARRDAEFVSFESLSRANTDPRTTRQRSHAAAYDVVIVDEAHHARNPTTRRYARLADLTAWSRVLLLSATPVHNATSDLHALLALFLGSRADHLAAHDLAACIVRRTRADVATPGTPARAPPTWLEVPADAAVLDALLDIPPPCPPRDGVDADALVTLGLVRAWSSTDAALRSALRRRLARAESLADALATGRHPTRTELRAWVVGDDATQLAFPELVTSEPCGVAAKDLLAAVAAHTAGVRSALRALDSSPGRADDARRDLLRSIRRRHPDRPIVMFSQYAETVHAMFKRLVPDGGVCAVTGRGAVVAGGPLPRGEALARFAPGALGVGPPRRADTIDVLIATDLLSEGLNLQDAAIVVHLDLPWTPARLAQRMGRVWRIGSRHADVYEYVIAPPPPAERISAIIARLQRKAAAASKALGDELTPVVAARAIQPLAPVPERDGRAVTTSERPHDVPSATEAIRRALIVWAGERGGARQHEEAPSRDASAAEPQAIVGAVRSAIDGWLAVVADGGEPRLVASAAGRAATTDPVDVLRFVELAGGGECVIPTPLVQQVRLEVDLFLETVRGTRDAGLAAIGSAAHARVAALIAEIVAASPAHRRAVVSSLARRAREALAGVRGVGGERVLRNLATYDIDPRGNDGTAEKWLARVAAVRPERSGGEGTDVRSADTALVPALLLLVSGDQAARGHAEAGTIGDPATVARVGPKAVRP